MPFRNPRAFYLDHREVAIRSARCKVGDDVVGSSSEIEILCAPRKRNILNFYKFQKWRVNRAVPVRFPELTDFPACAYFLNCMRIPLRHAILSVIRAFASKQPCVPNAKMALEFTS